MTVHHLTTATWSAAPKGLPAAWGEYFTSEDHAVDVAHDWSIELGGTPVVIYRNDTPWIEVTA